MAARILDFLAEKQRCEYENRRQQLMCELRKLTIRDMDAIYQLKDYCFNRANRVDERVQKLLIGKEILAKDGTLPDITNEAMYEIRTGKRPFWLSNRL